MYLLSAFPEKQAEYSISIARTGHEMGHGDQAAFLGEVKQKPRPASQISRYGRVVSPCEPTLPPGHCAQDSESLY